MNSDTSLRRRTNCSPYSREELGRFRDLLAAQRRRALRSYDELLEAARRTPGDSFGELLSLPQHLGDLASETFDQTISIDFLARIQDEIAEVDDALERIELRCYGLCESCGGRIPEERLFAIPAARLCVPCKSELES